MVDFPINSMVALSNVFCVSLPGRVQKKTSESSESFTIINHYQSSPFPSWLRQPPTSSQFPAGCPMDARLKPDPTCSGHKADVEIRGRRFTATLAFFSSRNDLLVRFT
jgi:hypothetical protein